MSIVTAAHCIFSVSTALRWCNHFYLLQVLDEQLVRKIRQERLPAFVELLKFKVSSPGLQLKDCPMVVCHSYANYYDVMSLMQTCTVGASVWGVVSDVLPGGLMVSLPDGLKGYVKAEEVRSFAAVFALQKAPCCIC